MKLFLEKSKISLLIFLLLSLPALAADDFPARSSSIVTDYTNTLSGTELASLEQKLVTFNDSTSTQVAVVIVSTTGDYDIADYASRLFDKWGIGQKEKNNGVLVLMAKDDRKVFIATGYGIEGALPDMLCKRIVERDIIPEFKNGDFFAGLDRGTSTIMNIVKGEYNADEYMSRKGKSRLAPFLFFIFFILLIIIFKMRSVSRYASGNSIPFWTAWMLMNQAGRGSRGSWGSFSSGGGGFGGGFGGFGGGSSGGGGAGGSW